MVFFRWVCLMSCYMERNPVDWPPSRLPQALLRLPLQRTTLFSLQSSSHCVHLNAVTDNYVRTFTSDKLLGLVDVGRKGIEGTLTLDNWLNRAMSSLPSVGLHSVGHSCVHSAITIREDPPPTLVGLYEHFLTFLKGLQAFVCMLLVLLYLTLQCTVRTAV